MKVTHKELNRQFVVEHLFLDLIGGRVSGMVTVVGPVPVRYCHNCRHLTTKDQCYRPTFLLKDIKEGVTIDTYRKRTGA